MVDIYKYLQRNIFEYSQESISRYLRDIKTDIYSHLQGGQMIYVQRCLLTVIYRYLQKRINHLYTGHCLKVLVQNRRMVIYPASTHSYLWVLTKRINH
jgi:hypothetical protein